MTPSHQIDRAPTVRPTLRRLLTLLFALSLVAAFALPAYADEKDNGRGNQGSSNNQSRGDDHRDDRPAATPTRAAANTTATTATAAATAATASSSAKKDDAKDAKDDKDGKKDEQRDQRKDYDRSDDTHGAAVSEVARGGEGGRAVSEEAHSGEGKPLNATISVQGILTAVGDGQITIDSAGAPVTVKVTDDTRIKGDDDSDDDVAVSLADLVGQQVRARGKRDAGGVLVARRIELRGQHGEAGDDAGDTRVELEGTVGTVGTDSFTLVTGTTTAASPASGTVSGTGTLSATASSTTAGTGTVSTTASGTVSGSPAQKFTVVVGADTVVKRNDATATLADLKPADDVEARGTLDGTTLTATRVLAEGPIATTAGTTGTGTTASTASSATSGTATTTTASGTTTR